MASHRALRARLDALERKIPPEEPSFAIMRSLVSPNPSPGGPPVFEGIAERTTTQIPTAGYPGVDEIWEPPLMVQANELPHLTNADATRYFELIGQTRNTKPMDIAARAVRGFVLWRNAPGGPAVARYGRDGIEVVQPLWPKYQTESQQLAATSSPLSSASERS